MDTFTIEKWTTETSGAFAVETFETLSDLTYTLETVNGVTGVTQNLDGGTMSAPYGELETGTAIGAKVGDFTSATPSGTGRGSTCKALSLDDICTNIALQLDPPVNGQGNIVPADGMWSLNAADTLGMTWMAKLTGGQTFNKLVFALRDAADAGAEVTVTGGGTTKTFSDLNNDARKLFVISFDAAVDAATVSITNSKGNDSFTLDGAAIADSGVRTITAVPIPATGLLLIGGLGGLAALRRRRKGA